MRSLFIVASLLLTAVQAQAQTDYDAKILSYEGLRYPCGEDSQPVLRIQNVGSNTMLSCEIDVWKNGLQIFTFDWQLAAAAAPGQVRQPILPVVPDVQPGDELEFRILTVNGVDDEDPTGNIIVVPMDDEPVEADSYNVLVDVRSGDGTAELEWRIKDASGAVLGQGGPYLNADEELQVPVSLAAGSCFEVEVVSATRSNSAAASVRIFSGAVAVLEVSSEEVSGILERGLVTGNDDVVPCTDQVTMEVYTDLDGDETTWTISDAVTNEVLCSGGPYQPGSLMTIAEQCCLPHGCYVLTVNDAGGNGMLNGVDGGYQLRYTGTGARIIDASGSGDFSTVSTITGNAYAFCLPMGGNALIHSSCDKYWWRSGEYLVAAEDVGVSERWLPGQPNSAQDVDTGYEFWFFAPDGGFSFRKFRNHRTSDGFGNVGATRACHLRVNNWATAQHIPENILMNVRVRARVAGVNRAWGPACRFVRNEALAQCPPTKLMDIPGNQFISCGQFRQFVSSQRIHARPISGANLYQWRFRIEAENIEIIRTSTTYFLNLGWAAAVAASLEDGKTYAVDVRASKNGGQTWCGLDGDAWGDVCSLTIGSTPGGMSGNAQEMLSDAGTGGYTLWPNPNSGDHFNLLWEDTEYSSTMQPAPIMEVSDVSGKLVLVQRLVGMEAGEPYTVALPGQWDAGLYTVRIRTGDRTQALRLLIKP